MESPLKSTSQFRMGRWHCYMLMMLHHLPAVTLLLLVALAGAATVGFILSPWHGIAILGIDMFLLVMFASFVIMAYGLGSITGCNTQPHSLHIIPGGLRVEFEEGEEAEISGADILPYKIYPGGVLVPVKGVKAGWVWLPPKAFDTPSDMQVFLKEIYKR